MSDSLVTYLHDHLSGAKFGIELLQFPRDNHEDDALGGFASVLLVDLEHDRQALESVLGRLGTDSSMLKEAAAWVGQKLSELKLKKGDFGTFEALEALALGIAGKLNMWRALVAISD